VTSWNRGAEVITGYSADEVLGVHISRFYPPEAQAKADRELDMAHLEGRCEVEAERVRRGGARYWASVTLTALRDANGTLRGFAQLTRDVTGKKQLERMKDEFVSIVSHELRTPLTAIRGALGLLSGGVGGELDPMIAELVDLARDNSERLVRLINDILDIERMASGRVSMERSGCEGSELAAQAVDAMRQMADDAGVVLEVSCEPCPLWADPDRVLQTLTNLLSNALKFTPAGGEVVVVGSREQGEVLVRVEDTGRGFDPARAEALFESFRQPHDADEVARGAGLGLYISRGIVEQHGGRLWATSPGPGLGATFAFALPLLEAPLAPRAQAQGALLPPSE
jgi:PAS domain S-box-containing protein